MVSERYLKGLVEMRRHLGTPEADQYLAKINEISSEFAKGANNRKTIAVTRNFFIIKTLSLYHYCDQTENI